MEQIENRIYRTQEDQQAPVITPVKMVDTLPAEIIKSLNGFSHEQLKESDNKIFLGWDQLNPAINERILLRKYETVKGYIISEKGIEIVVGFKDRRKSS